LLLGFSYYGAKDFAEAATQLAPVAKADPDNVELHHVLAQSCLWAKEYSCALDEFRQILQRDPDSATAHVLMGEALDGVRRTSDAIAEFQAAASIAPREPNIHFGLGYLFWKLHKLDAAKQEFENELAVDPGNAQALAYLADVEIKNNHTDAALPLLRKATALKDDLRIAYLDLGGVLAQEKKYPEAVIAFQHAVNLDPKEPDAHYRLGRVYQAMGKTDESKKEFAMVRELRAKTDEGLVQKMSPAPPSLDQSQVMRPD
jgi:tetratricopeptide (TPR) repeat protein